MALKKTIEAVKKINPNELTKEELVNHVQRLMVIIEKLEDDVEGYREELAGADL